ncbi:MAG: sigma-70 family RNA polymerase sigma factor [Gemmataceae bacterium]
MTPNDLQVVRSNLFRVLRRTAGDADLAEDVCQTVLLKTWLRSQAFGGMPSFSYIVRCGLNALYSAQRRRRPRQLAEGFDQASREVDPANAALVPDRARIAKVFDRLPPCYRDVARLRFLHEWREKKIAEHLDLPIGTAKTRVFRAKRILKEQLRGYWID